MSTLSSANVTDGNLVLKERTHTINNKIQLHILGEHPNKLGSWLMGGTGRNFPVSIYANHLCCQCMFYISHLLLSFKTRVLQSCLGSKI